ncbi:MAG: imelysin [Gammaproteobacteria bacterium]|nr:imelysin [Gammaproteobacteria bacterium]MBU1489968.1 imelysin [Gammaproteobacteria bacterium]MBU2064270.1 imelysin [Gammaproteobacteria bacterium]MBU2137906.1 imelysin [Gammaproteobacteria bacterium]MBU2323043.1 imelysin [Gammaproteobacteria bacterium]
MIRSPLTLAGLALALSACNASDPQQQLSADLTDGVLLPAYSAWHEANKQLDASADAFCSGSQDLTAARQAFLTTQSAWAGLQPLQVGPLAEGNRAWQVQFWPDKKNLVARQVEALLTRTPQLTAANLDNASVVVQGLTAYEYVLYDSSIDLTDPTTKARYCPLLQAIGEHQQALSAEVLGQWQAKDGMAAELKTFPNARYAEAPEAVAELLRAEVSALDGLKKKLGTPLGRQSKGVPQPYQAEAWRSQASLAMLAASLASAERIWLGAEQNGVQRLLGDDQDALRQRINEAFADTRQRLAALPRPLGELVNDDEGRSQLNALYDSLNALHRLHEAELAKALGIQLGFNAHDGD